MVIKVQVKLKIDFECWQDYINIFIQYFDCWNGYDCDIQFVVGEYNCYLMGNVGYLLLDWQIVKVMVWVEIGVDLEVWQIKLMQIGNLGDFGLNILLCGEEGSDLIVLLVICIWLNVGLV